MIPLWALSIVTTASSFELPLKATTSLHRFTLWNSEPLALGDGLSSPLPDPVLNVLDS